MLDKSVLEEEQKKIQSDIENDFNECIALLSNFIKIRDGINVGKPDSFLDYAGVLFPMLDIKDIKRKQFDVLCMIMGQMCELAFKYLIKIKHTQIHKNHTFDDFSRTQALYNLGSLRNLIKLGYITQDDYDYITAKFGSQNKDKFHNFTYLSMIVERLMPDTYKNMRRYFELSHCGKCAFENYRAHRSNSNSYIDYYEALEDILFPNPDRMELDKKEQFIQEMRKVQTTYGDAFNRLRYFSNNPDGKKFNYELMFPYTYSIIHFIMEVHDKNNDLLIDPELLVARQQAIRYHDLLDLSKDEINDIFNRYVYNREHPIDLRTELAPMLIGCYSYDEVREINEKCKQYGFDPLEIYRTGITFEERLFFHELGWDKIGYIEDIVEGLVYDGKRRRNLEQIKALINNTKNRLGEELFNFFISNGIFNPLYMFHCTYDEYGQKRTMDEIKQIVECDVLITRAYELSSNDYNDIDLESIFEKYGITDRREKIQYIYDSNNQKRTIREVIELLIENQEKSKEK